jgi:peptide/nickel transport system substrate-binding protein
MAQALVAGEIDLLWGALLPEKLDLLRHNPALKVWSGPSAFKRNLILLHSEPALAQREVREALNLLIDREAISTSVYEGAFKALYSPIPMGIHGHHEVMPHTDVARAGELLGAAGHGEARPLALDLWWARDHYGDQEQLLAQTLKSQLEVNGMVQVRLHEAPWSEYNVASADCHYPAFLLGWQPDYLDLSTSVDFFALSTATPDLCSNYANPAMDELILAAQTEAHPERRLALYRDIQQLWARDIPTIPLVQGTVNAASIGALDGVHIDPLGLLHYESLHK